MELYPNFKIAQKHIDTAVKFGIDVGSLTSAEEAETYVMAFIHRLLLQRDKIDLGLLTDYIDYGVTNVWQEVLSTLEKSDRKLVAIRKGLVFLLFCPTINSTWGLKDDSWIKTLTAKLKQFLQKIGK